MRAILLAAGSCLFLLASLGAAPAQERARQSNANDCLIWVANSLLANSYFQVAKNGCDYAIEFEYRYEQDVGAGCVGASPCTGTLAPNEIKRFTAGAIRSWVCRAPAVPKFPDIARSGSCE